MDKRLVLIKRSNNGHWVGDGFFVKNIFSYNDMSVELSPFILMDYAAPMVFPPTTSRRGVGAHPHRGFETVTIVYQGGVAHRDSSGGGGTIEAGDVQWMTAASGLLHEEFHSPEFAKNGGSLEMVQLWVNLPEKDKMAPPGYQSLKAASIPGVNLPEGSGWVRIIAGDFAGNHGPAKTFTPMNVWDCQLNGGKVFPVGLHEGNTTAIFLLSGKITIQEHTVAPGELAVMSLEGESLTIAAQEEARFLLLEGKPVKEPVFGRGPFVMNSREQLSQAINDFKNGQFGAISN